jgi:hypothetical protein
MKSQKTQKEVTILNIYRFKNVSRVCFEVLSSDNETRYHTCFDGSVEKHSCTCPAGSNGRRCYHVSGLTARAAEYFASRQPVQAEKANPVAEAEAFIAKVQAEKAAQLHNSNEGHFEMRGERLIPMR